jgi:hypothetical protein
MAAQTANTVVVRATHWIQVSFFSASAMLPPEVISDQLSVISFDGRRNPIYKNIACRFRNLL